MLVESLCRWSVGQFLDQYATLAKNLLLNCLYSWSQRKNHSNFGDPLTLHLLPTAGNHVVHLSSEINQHCLIGTNFVQTFMVLSRRWTPMTFGTTFMFPSGYCHSFGDPFTPSLGQNLKFSSIVWFMISYLQTNHIPISLISTLCLVLNKKMVACKHAKLTW